MPRPPNCTRPGWCVCEPFAPGSCRWSTTRPKVVSSPNGMAHYYRSAFGTARTLCGKPVPQHRGWFGPVDRPATCSQCVRAHA